MMSLLATGSLFAQQEVMVRDLHTYDTTPESQNDLSDHPLEGEEVTFDAVVVSYPKNSGLASITDAGVPGRIHVFVTDINAVEEGEAGMTIQIVVEGARRETLEALNRGDVISVTGDLGFFGANAQFDATDVEYLGNIQDAEYEDLAELLEPETVQLTDINEQAEAEDEHQWVAENYSTYIHRYVKIEGLEVVDRLIADDGRPWFVLTDGNTILTSNDTSLRFRNDKEGYAYDATTDDGLGYNWRRIAEGHDEPFVAPAPGSIVDISGYIVQNTFDPAGFDESEIQSTLKIAPWDDGVVWTADGNDVANRETPEDWPNDLVVQGFAPNIDNLTVTPDSGVANSDEVTISVDVELPEDDYTLESVNIAYSDYAYTADSGDTTTTAMTADGNTYTFTFDSYEDFTTVDFTITATAETPDGVETKATEKGSFSVESSTETAPVSFSPKPDGTFANSVNVTLSSATADAVIYYTLDGSDPDETSTEYSETLSFFETTTINAIAISEGMDDSPITSRTYEVEDQSVQVTTLAEINSGEVGENYRYNGDAVVTYTHSNRNQIFIMDDTGGMLIDDPDNIIVTEYEAGDVMTGLLGSLSEFNGLFQFRPLADPGAPTGQEDVTPVEITLNDLEDQHKSMLVTIEDVSFEDTGTFEGGTDYNITDPSLADGEAVNFRTNFGGADYIGEEIPGEPVTMTAIVGYYGDFQLTPRSASDMGSTVSNERDDSPNKFALEQNYPNPFNPTTNIRYSVADVSDVSLVIYDILGRKVATLVNEVKAPGAYTVNFDASRLGSGAYFYRIDAGDFVSIKKMMLIK
ncbi:MAG: chitobiase/beta-hexosaminidase C-terminal domain-containing protein [Balneolaceae bacterium]